MDRSQNINNTMNTKRFTIYLFIFLALMIVWKLTVIESGKYTLNNSFINYMCCILFVSVNPLIFRIKL